MNIHFATDEEITSWNDLLVAHNANVLQSRQFAEQKIAADWQPRYIMAGQRAITILERKIPFYGKLWYCPKGPAVSSAEDLELLLRDLRPFAKKNGVFSLKIEPEIPSDQALVTSDLIKTKSIQPESTVIINLEPPEEDILKSLNQKGRHSIRRASKDGATAKPVNSTPENFRIMYDLLEETSKAAGYPIRHKAYYDEFYTRFSEAGIGQLFFAYVNNKPVAGAYALVLGKKSLYIYGASSRDRGVYGVGHFLQWHVLLWAKSKGSLEHDLGGTPSSDRIDDTTHPLYNVGKFKTGFIKKVTDYVGTYDVPIRPLKEKLWYKLVEKIMRRRYFQKHGQSMY
jgi:lipid II:glycine glycyltransferase (peptidoglycan interpeptide bridge formation enzyme)